MLKPEVVVTPWHYRNINQKKRRCWCLKSRIVIGEGSHCFKLIKINVTLRTKTTTTMFGGGNISFGMSIQINLELSCIDHPPNIKHHFLMRIKLRIIISQNKTKKQRRHVIYGILNIPFFSYRRAHCLREDRNGKFM